MHAYSPDLRQRIVDAVAAGESKSAVARRFGVHRETVRRYVARQATTGGFAPRPVPGAVPRIPAARLPVLVRQLAADPDATVEAHRERWEREQGQAVSWATMRRAIVRTDWTRKKSR